MTTCTFRHTVLVASISMLAACAAPTTDWVQKSQKEAGYDQARPHNGVLVSNAPYIDRAPIEYRETGPRVTVNTTNMPLRNAIAPLVKASGWAVAWAGGANPSHSVTVQVLGLPRTRAIRKIAMAAGYVAIIDPNDKQVTITPTATYIYQLPVGLFDKDAAEYQVSASSSGSGGSGNGGGGSQDMGGSSSGNASSGSSSSISVTGTARAENPARFLETITTLAGKGATVTADWQVGIITVHAGVLGLERTRQWVQQVVQRAMTQVDIQIAVLNVDLSNEPGFGLDWNRIIQHASSSWKYTISTASLINNPTGTITRTTASINALINVLASNHDVAIVAKPHVLARNGKLALIFNGTEIPYLGKTSAVVTGGNGNTTQSGAEVSYALNGISLGVVPSILAGTQVDVKIVPLLSRVGQFRQFKTSDGGILEAPEKFTRQLFLNVVVPDGQTVILGGISQKQTTQQGQSLPGLQQLFNLASSQEHLNGELVMMISTRILPPPKYQPLIKTTL